MNYQRNSEVIERFNQQFSKRIAEAKQPEYITMNKSRNKKPNFIYKKGSSFYPAYNMTNPVKGIDEIVKKEIYHKDTGSIIIGFGLGHYVYRLCKHKVKEHKVIVVEPYPFYIRKAFENYDFSKWLLDGTMMIVGSETDLSIAVGAQDLVNIIQGWNIICEKYAYDRPGEYGKIIEYANGLINQLTCNIGTVMGAGPQIAENDILNLPYIIRHRGVAELKDLYKGCPAVLVSTGPSLEKNVFYLKDMRSRVIIIAVAQALRVLMAYDIVPDFICTVDYGKVNEDHFKGLYDSKVPLVCLNRTYAEILKKWEGTKYIVASQIKSPNSDKENIIDYIANKGNLIQGGSVSHMCFGFAMHLGCNPIIMIGQDLAYESNKSHIPLADASGEIVEKNGKLEWNVKDGRSCLGENTYQMSGTVLVPGYFGGLVKTNRGLASFITTYQRIITEIKEKHKIINATEGGAKIEGAEQYTLIDAVKKFAKFNINKKRLQNFQGLIDNPDKEIEKIIPMLSNDIKVMIEIRAKARKGFKALEGIEKIKEKEEIKKALAKNEENAKIAQNKAKDLPLLGLFLYAESRIIANREYNVNGKLKHILKDKDDLLIRVKRSRIILQAAEKACTKLLKSYRQTRKILQMHLSGEDVLTSKEEYQPDLSDVEDMFKAGNWGRPLLECRKIALSPWVGDWPNWKLIEIRAARMREESIERNKKENEKNSELILYTRCLDKAREYGKKAEFGKALIELKQAVDLFPDKEEGLWGYATALHHVGKITEAIDIYKKLIDQYPDNLNYQFEYGQVVLKKDIKQGMKLIGEVMGKTEQFDNFLVRIGDIYFELGAEKVKKSKEINYKLHEQEMLAFYELGIECYEKAIIAYEHYLKKFPPDTGSLTNLIRAYKIIGKKGLAKKVIKKYKEWMV